VTVQLEHAYGYNGRVARDNLFFTLDKQEIVYWYDVRRVA